VALAMVAAGLLAAAQRDAPVGWLGLTLGDDHAAGAPAAHVDRVLPDSPAARADAS